MIDKEWGDRLARSSLWVFVGMLFGRLAGFVRDIVLAAQFGASGDTDIAILMLTLPDLLVNILVGGGLSIALIPTFKRYGEGLRAHCLFVQSSVVVVLLFAVVALLLTNMAGFVTKLAAPGFEPQQVADAVPPLNVVLWLIPLTAVAGVSTAYLHANNYFAVAAFGTFTFNSVVLVGLGVLSASDNFLGNLALFILGGGLLRWGVQLLAVPRDRFTFNCYRWRLIDGELIRRYLHAASAGGLLLLLPVIGRAMASLQGEGGLSLFSYAMKLVEFPLGISVMVLSVSIFPLLSQCFVRNQHECSELVALGIQTVLLITVAITLPLAWFSSDFARLVFERGAMTSQDVATIGQLLSLGVLALPFQGAASILTATYNAASDTGFILRLNIIAVVLFGLVGYWCVTHVGLSALMVSFVVTYSMLVLLQLWAIHRRLSLKILGLLWRDNVVLSLLIMLLTGSCLLLLLQWLQLGVYLNVVGAVLVGASMLLVGVVTTGSHKVLIDMLLKTPKK